MQDLPLLIGDRLVDQCRADVGQRHGDQSTVMRTIQVGALGLDVTQVVQVAGDDGACMAQRLKQFADILRQRRNSILDFNVVWHQARLGHRGQLLRSSMPAQCNRFARLCCRTGVFATIFFTCHGDTQVRRA
ncbi:hypothetical protein D3C76_1391920 [compost metagenome]